MSRDDVALRLTAIALGSILAATPAFPLFLAGDGDGPASRDCLVGLEWDASTGVVTDRPAAHPTLLSCSECDPGCDRDGEPNGRCAIRLRVCANNPARACKPRDLDRVQVVLRSGLERIAYPFLAPSAALLRVCGPWIDVDVRTRGTRSGRMSIRLRAHGALNRTIAITDYDRFTMLCMPRADACPGSAAGAFAIDAGATSSGSLPSR